MPRVLKRPEAESDLDEIWWYIAQDSPDHADPIVFGIAIAINFRI